MIRFSNKASSLASHLALGAFLVLSVSFVIFLGNFLPPPRLQAAVAGGFFLLLAGILFLRFPHRVLMATGAFLLLQDLLGRNLEAVAPGMEEAVKHGDEALIVVFFLITFFRAAARRTPVRRSRLEIPLIGFVVVSLLGSAIASAPFGITLLQLFLYLKGFLLLFIIMQLPVDENTARRYARFFTGAGLLILLTGLIDLIDPLWFRTTFRTVASGEIVIEQRYGITSVKSIFTHPGVFGWFTAFIALYGYAFYMTYNRARYLWLGVLFSVGSFLSMRRRNLSGIAGALAGALWLQPLAKKIRYGIVIGASAVIFTILAWPKIEGLFRDLGAVYITPDNPREEARNVLYITSRTLLNDYFPWGAGLGRFGSWMSQVHYSPLYKKYGLSGTYGITRKNPKYITDTFWPAIIGETGLLGLIFYLWICFRIFRLLYRQAKRADTLFERAFTLGTLMIFIESLIESVAGAVYTSPPAVYFIFGSVGLALALPRYTNQPDKTVY